jgi:prepilin peptidase CpaA
MPLPLATTLFAFVLACCAVDLRARRIPNALSGGALVVGVLLNALYSGWSGALSSLGGVGVMIATLIGPFALGGLGGGDVKMMAAVGAFLGPRLALFGLIAGMALGGVVMVVHLLRVGRLGEKLLSLKNMILSLVLTRSVDALRMQAGDPGTISLPYSIPLGLGTAVVVVATAVSH